MKKILSVFLSLILVLSMCFDVTLSKASSSDNTMIIRTNMLFDSSSANEYTFANGTPKENINNSSVHKLVQYDSTKRSSMYISRRAGGSISNTLSSDNTTFPGDTVIKLHTKTSEANNGSTYFIFNNKYDEYDGKYFANTLAKYAIQNTIAAVSGEFYTTSDCTPQWQMVSTGVKSSSKINIEGIEPGNWYKFKCTVDLTKTESNVLINYTKVPSDLNATPQVISVTGSFDSNSITHIIVNNYNGLGETLYWDDINIQYDLPLIYKASIKSVGSDGVVADGQNKVSITFNTEIPDLTKDYVKINESGKEDNLVSGIEITSDGTNPVVIASLSENLKDWSEYEITIDPLCYGAGATQVTNGGAPEAVTSINGSFITPSPSFGMKDPVFSVNAENLNAKALVVNTSGTPQDTTFIFSAFDSEGRISAITSVTEADFNNSLGEYLEADVLVNAGESFDFFVVNGWSSKKPLFGKTYAVNSSGEEIAKSAFSSGEPMADSGAAIKLGEFDYENIKINVSLDTKTSAVTDGILYVYKSGESLSDINLPVYAKPVSTASTGRLTLDILLPQSITYGQYKAEYVSEDISTSETFNYYSPTELEAIKKQAIADSVKACTSSGELKQIILGCDSAGNMINNNFEYIAEGTDLTDYSSLNNKESFYLNMLSMVGGVTDFNSLCTLIESCASSQKASEIAAHKAQIVADAKASINAAGLMKVILGIDDSEKVVNNNFELISQNTDLSVYNTLKNKAAVFSHMISTVKNTTDFADLVYRFEQAAITQKSKENTPVRPSSNNSSFGGSSTPIKETTSAPQTGSSQPGTSVLASKFNDMSGHWASNYVDALYDRGIMNGYEDGSFRGENSISRAELAKTLVEAFAVLASEGNTFSDVSDDNWYSSYVAAASASGIVNGFEDGTFAPNRAVTRQDAVLMLYRAMSLGRNLPIGYTFFADDLDISEYASGAIRTLGDMGIVSGNSEKQFLPLNSITRAEVATIICRALDYIESH